MAHPTQTIPLSAGVTTSFPHPSGSGLARAPTPSSSPGLLSPGSGGGRPPTPTTTLKAEAAHEIKAAQQLTPCLQPVQPCRSLNENLPASPTPPHPAFQAPPGRPAPLPRIPRPVPRLPHGSHHSASGCGLGTRLPRRPGAPPAPRPQPSRPAGASPSSRV